MSKIFVLILIFCAFGFGNCGNVNKFATELKTEPEPENVILGAWHNLVEFVFPTPRGYGYKLSDNPKEGSISEDSTTVGDFDVTTSSTDSSEPTSSEPTPTEVVPKEDSEVSTAAPESLKLTSTSSADTYKLNRSSCILELIVLWAIAHYLEG